jgi:hypothetical protein
MRSVEFCLELRLEAAAGLFELSFSPHHVSQQCVQLLWTQCQQSEHKYEQDFGTPNPRFTPWLRVGPQERW